MFSNRMRLTHHQLIIVAAAPFIGFLSQTPCAATTHNHPNHFHGVSIAFSSRYAATKVFQRRCCESENLIHHYRYVGFAHFSSPLSSGRNRVHLKSTTDYSYENGADEGCTPIGGETAVDEDSRRNNQRQVLPSNILGPPEPLHSLQIRQYLDAFRVLPPRSTNDDNNSNNETDRNIHDTSTIPNHRNNQHKFKIERASETPNIFLLRNFLTSPECQQIQSMARHNNNSQRSPAGTISRERDERARKNCLVAWLPSLPSPYASNRVENSHEIYGENATYSDLIPNLVASASNILLSPSILSNPTAGVEDLQVLEYGPGGEFVLHHDGESRILTVLYYLNGIGGTWFPLADVAVDDADTNERRTKSWSMPKNRKDALDLIERRNMTPGKNGLLIRGRTTGASGEKTVHDALEAMDGDSDNEHVIEINAGDAIAFYNYLDDGSGMFDWRSIHCGLPTSEEDHAKNKWIANHWFRLNYLDGIE